MMAHDGSRSSAHPRISSSFHDRIANKSELCLLGILWCAVKVSTVIFSSGCALHSVLWRVFTMSVCVLTASVCVWVFGEEDINVFFHVLILLLLLLSYTIYSWRAYICSMLICSYSFHLSIYKRRYLKWKWFSRLWVCCWEHMWKWIVSVEKLKVARASLRRG